jgi:hypothetical protein
MNLTISNSKSTVANENENVAMDVIRLSESICNNSRDGHVSYISRPGAQLADRALERIVALVRLLHSRGGCTALFPPSTHVHENA